MPRLQASTHEGCGTDCALEARVASSLREPSDLFRWKEARQDAERVADAHRLDPRGGALNHEPTGRKEKRIEVFLRQNPKAAAEPGAVDRDG